LLQRIPMLGDRYFGTRPLSDMAERAHAVHQLRSVGDAGWILSRSVFELAAVSIGLILFWPSAWPGVIALAAVSAGFPVLANAPLRERDLRARTHLGALSRFYLDALLGLVAVRAHGAERALQREHESLLVEWVRASRARLRAIVVSEAAQLTLGLGISAWLVYRYLSLEPATGGVLLLAYWAFRLPVLGDDIALVARRYPTQRSIVLRLMEPLSVPADGDSDSPDTGGTGVTTTAGACAVKLDRVSVVIGGNAILRDVTLAVPAGTHVAIVGPSGAGKSTLLALLLGWLRPTAGDVRIDGAALIGPHLDAIRRRTAWVDPSVQLWNRTLLENLVYGSSPESRDGLPDVIDDADLRSLLQSLPNGMATVLGEGGALVSGGEGQRVRLARALLRGDARLVVADEPFRGLDSAARETMLRRMRERFHDATILFATHDVSVTGAFERVIVMHDGEIVEEGAPATLAARAGSRYRGLLETDRRMRERLWRSGGWRRLSLAGGIISDVPVPPVGHRTHLSVDDESARWTA
jgi:ATP-binding cassette subfamily B protein